MFLFREKSLLQNVPHEGEFVRWLSESFPEELRPLSLLGTREIGTMLAFEESKEKEYVCRPFNSMEVNGDIIIKRPIDAQGEKLAKREIAWYKEAKSYGFDQIPDISEYQPLTMGRINGKNIFKTSLSTEDQQKVIRGIVDGLNKLHSCKSVEPDSFSQMNAYYYKTIDRIESIRDLVPFADRDYIRINGKECKNPYLNKGELRRMVKELLITEDPFVFIHGDCTFSNTMVEDDLNVIFLDPRGYFGYQELYGDPYYDWAKVYYSLNGDYDQFNNKKFVLDVEEDEVKLSIDTNGWKDQSDYYLSLIPECDEKKIKLLHAIIWLSLSTYAWEDYDSICGAFYNGTLLMEELWEK
jgi:thiamine kinase-like enzyme